MREQIAYFEDLLAHPKKILLLIQDDMRDLAEKYGDDRRTRIAADATEELSEADLVQDEAVLISLTERGYIKRVAASAFRSQSSRGTGCQGTYRPRMKMKSLHLFQPEVWIRCCSSRIKAKFILKRFIKSPMQIEPPKGYPLVNVLALDASEHVTAAIAVSDFSAHGYCMLATVRGKVKRVVMEEFAAVRPSGLIAMGLDNGDQLRLGACDQRQR